MEVMKTRHEIGGRPFARQRAYYPVRHVQPPPSVIPLCYMMPPLAPQQPSHPCQVPYFGSQMQKRNPPFTHGNLFLKL